MPRQGEAPAVEVPTAWRPSYGDGSGDDGSATTWRVRVLPGPQAAPDYFLPSAIEARQPGISQLVCLSTCSPTRLTL